MNTTQLLLTLNWCSLPKNAQHLLPKKSVITLNKDESFADSMKRFLKSFYSDSEIYKRETIDKTFYYFESVPLEGIWCTVMILNNKRIQISGIFDITSS